MTDLVRSSFTLANPRTGEVVDLDGPTEDLGQFLADLREQESMWREAKKLVTREIVHRMDQQAHWTIPAGPYTLSSNSPAPREEFDGPALHEALDALVRDGVITVDALDAAVQTVVEYKPRKAGINALRKLGGGVARVIDEHSTPVVKERYVKVERA